MASLGEETNETANVRERERRRMLSLNLCIGMPGTKPALIPNGNGLGNPFLRSQVVEFIARVDGGGKVVLASAICFSFHHSLWLGIFAWAAPALCRLKVRLIFFRERLGGGFHTFPSICSLSRTISARSYMR